MRAHRFWRDQFHAYRLWILERRPAPPPALAATRAVPATLPSDLELVFLDRQTRGDWMRQRGAEADWPQFQAALAHNHDLIVARRGSETVGWAWLGYERVFLAPLGRDIKLEPGTAYLYDAYVRPAERGRGIGSALVAARCAHADALGVERLVSHVLVGNVASLRSLQAQGFVVLGKTLFVRALVLRMWTREPLPSPRAA
jgi:ribosomal protein S18 acetylase RimI-like enzyme